MRFAPWYPLSEVGDRVAPGENVLQLRVARGLVDYPRGKSAMVRYVHAPDARAEGRALAAAYARQDLWCRHLIEIPGATDLAAFCAKLREEFERRFGSVPLFERSTP